MPKRIRKEQNYIETGEATPKGALYLIAIDIGNPDDIGGRALKLMSRSDVLAAEDTRSAHRLLAGHDIKRSIVSYHEHNAARQKYRLMRSLLAGKSVALISEAGTPLISDPGWGLVELAIARDISVRPIPGPCAFISALICSGLPCHEFIFSGFVPRRVSSRLKLWQNVASRTITTALYVPSHLIVKVLSELTARLPLRPLAVHKEISKPYERIWRNRAQPILEEFTRFSSLSKGEFVLVIAGSDRESKDDARRGRSFDNPL